MKFKNLFLALLTTLTIVSCSTDNDTDVEILDSSNLTIQTVSEQEFEAF